MPGNDFIGVRVRDSLGRDVRQAALDSGVTISKWVETTLAKKIQRKKRIEERSRKLRGEAQ